MKRETEVSELRGEKEKVNIKGILTASSQKHSNTVSEMEKHSDVLIKTKS